MRRTWLAAGLLLALAAPAQADSEQREPNFVRFPVGATYSSTQRVVTGLVPSGPGLVLRGLHTPELTLEITGPGEITVLGADGGSEVWHVGQNYAVFPPEDAIIGPAGERIWHAPIRVKQLSGGR